MKKLLLSLFALAAVLAPVAPRLGAADAAVPHLERRGAAVQLIVDGAPFLVRGGELSNTAASNPEHMAATWPHLQKVNVNTVLAAVAWSWIEPEEGRYDFAILDQLIRDARAHDMRIALLWFGSWKNGLSSFAPAWVKADSQRFPRVRIAGGKAIEVLSTLSAANRDADARAFAAVMQHIREVDRGQNTVVMVQLENEVGVLGDSRDRNEAANRAFAGPVPEALLAHLRTHADALLPEFRRIWEQAGRRTAGTWTEVFGTGPAADEIFMAWNYATYINRIAEAGKAAHPIPMFVNAWIVQPEDKGPGDYPSGGPQTHMHDVWRAGGPAIDLLCPDIYLPDFPGITAMYTRSGNPLFVPESRGDAGGAANAFFAIGARNAIGYSMMGVDSAARLTGFRPGTGPEPAAPTNVADLPFPRAYEVLGQLTPLILEAQRQGTIGAAWLTRERPDETIELGGYHVNIGLVRNRRAPDVLPDLGYGLVMAVGPDEFYVAGAGIQVTFQPATPGPAIAGLAIQEDGRFEKGKWVVTRRLAGDDSVLDYNIAAVAARNQSGSGVRFRGMTPGINRVKLYRYE